MKYFLAIIIAACAMGQKPTNRIPPCVSQCGMLLETKGNGSIDCNNLNEAEDYLLHQIDRYFCATYPTHCYDYACGQVFGWQVAADGAEIMVTDVMSTTTGNDGGMLTLPLRIPVSGLANCKTKEIWLGAGDNWRKGSYPHEMLHVIQDCNGPGVETEDDAEGTSGHEGWTEGGFYEFLRMVRAGEI